MAEVLVVGSAVLDFVYQMETLPKTAEKYKANMMEIVGGGCAANAAVAISRLGGDAKLLARFGNDYVYDIVRQDLESEGIDLSLLDVSNGRSAMSSVYVNADGERQIMAFRGTELSEHPTPLEPRDTVVLADTRWPDAARMAFASTTGATVLDGEAPIPRDLAMAASHVVFSEQGLADFTGIAHNDTALLEVARVLPGFVAVTCGPKGVIWVDEGVLQHEPAFQIDVQDTLGAGDVWHGTFALMLAEGHTEEYAIRSANAAAAIKCTGTGRSAAPTRNALNQFLKERT
ncbi:MAG: PfkB family carbohydrate kinase [Litoreibacter sp.]